MNITTKLPGPKPRRHLVRRIFATTLAVVSFTVGAWVLFNRQFIIDQITVWQYEMPAAVEQLADDSGMNNHGKFLFEASRPELNDRTAFNKNCKMRESQAIILGCYAARRIYVFNIEDTRVIGARTVTTAHEMLHAAYERLGSSERENVDEMLKKQYAQTTDQTLLDLVKVYEKTEPGQQWNELHSLFATEVAELSPELETYYKKYFAGRGKVVAEYQKYHQVFTDLENQAKEIEARLADGKAAIDAATTQYETDSQQLSADITSFNNCASTLNCFASQAAFNRQRASLIARQNELTTRVDQINAKVDQYNADVAKLNTLGVEAEKLNSSLDSHAPQIE